MYFQHEVLDDYFQQLLCKIDKDLTLVALKMFPTVNITEMFRYHLIVMLLFFTLQ